MTDSLKNVRTRAASTHRPYSANPVSTPSRADQIKTAGGGYAFPISDRDQVTRFLILGSEANFYRSGAEQTKLNSAVVTKLASQRASGIALVDLIVEISTAGRAPKVNPAIFALAVAAASPEEDVRAYALANLNSVVRTGTHLFLFAAYVEQFRGWGRGLKRAIANWYLDKGADKAAFQAVKYRQREGWSHRDLFRLSHPETADEAFKGLGEWVLRDKSDEAPAIIKGFVKAQAVDADIPALVREYGLSWEMLPTEALNDTKVWDALLESNLPLGALLRQLPRLTRLGMFPALGGQTSKVVARLNDVEELRRARLHPINILVAMKTYAQGRSAKGDGTWTPNQKIVDALSKAFYLAYETVEPTNKNTLIGVDVSGSMGSSGYSHPLPGGISPAEIAAAISMVTLATEPNAAVYGFATNLVELPISPAQRLDDVLKTTVMRNFGSTNPGALFEKAIQDKLPVETFIVVTDNDVNGGRHVHTLLQKYRNTTGIDAKLIVLATSANEYSIGDPNDAGTLNLAGFDSAIPSLIADFSRGL